MKKLSNKLLKSFILYALIVLATSVPAYYFLVDNIWIRELDQHNKVIAAKTEVELNRLNLDDSTLLKSIMLWNKIQPGTNLKELKSSANHDSTYTILRRNIYLEAKGTDRFRGLVKTIRINEKHFLLTVETNVEETEETVLFIAMVTFFFFLVLVVGFLILNKRLSMRLWKPFRNSLEKLKSFNLNQQNVIEFEQSDTIEFEELNVALRKLIEKNVAVYKSQKEFTDNASHELQTPLAIIKNKLDLLLQKETLTDRQYQIIEDINKSLTRISRINKNLLLLTKIENHQFNESEMVDVSALAAQAMEQLKLYADDKKISLKSNIEAGLSLKGNSTLIEMLLNNLLLNAIRHSQLEDAILIKLDRRSLSVFNTGRNALATNNMFKRFANISNESAGSGLGLAIINEICKLHKWNIQYQFENNFHQFEVKFQTT